MRTFDAPGSDLDATGKNPNPGWTVDLSPTTSSPAVLDGTYKAFLSLLDADGGALACGNHSAGFNLDIRDSEVDAAEASPPPSDDVHECVAPGTASATRFRLLPHPGGVYPGEGREAVPVYRMGSAQFGNVATDTIEVLNFAGADSILVYAGPTLLAELTPTSSTATLADEVFGELTMAVVDADLTAGLPEIRVIGTCATTGLTVSRPQGYKVTSAAFNTWFGVTADAIARVQNDTGGGRTLLLEIPGTTVNMGLPLVHTGGSNYTLDFVGFDLEVHGTVVHGASTLSITVASGWVGSTAIPTGTYNFPKL